MKVKELIRQLENLPPESEIYSVQWFKRNSDILPLAGSFVKIKSVGTATDQDTNQEVFFLETEYKEPFNDEPSKAKTNSH